VTLSRLELILPGFLKLFSAQTVHIDGCSAFVDELVPMFDAAQDVILTDSQLPKLNAENKNVSVVEDVTFSDTEKEVTFYHLSLKSMSGLVEADRLTRFWKNIKNKREEQVLTKTLDDFYFDIEKNQANPVNWLCLDSLQTLTVLKGAGKSIESFQGLILRMLVEESDASENLGCSESEVDYFLNSNSFMRVAEFETRHPAFIYGLYIRDLSKDVVKVTEMLQIETGKRRKLEADKSLLEADSIKSLETIASLQSMLTDMPEKAEQSKVLSEVVSNTQEKFDEKLYRLESLLNDAREVSSFSKSLVERTSTAQTQFAKNLELSLSLLRESNKKTGNQEKALGFIKDELSRLSNLPQLLKELRFQNFLQGHSDNQLIAGLWTHMGESAYENQKFAQATEYFQLAIDAGGEKAWCFQAMAESMARHDTKADAFWYVPEQKKSMNDFGRWDPVVRLYRKALSFDPDIGRKFNERFMSQSLAMEDSPIGNPIYIVGCGHSGTSILLRLIGNHENIWPVKKESALFLKSDAHVSQLMRQWDEACKKDNRTRWVEKTPPHIFQIPRLLASRPKAQILLIVRDGRDVVASLKHRKGYENIDDRIDRWVYDNMAGLPFWEHERIHVLTYEDLVSESEKTLREVFNFLGEGYDSDILKFHKNQENWYTDELSKPKEINEPKDHLNLRNWQVNQPLFDGRGKWKKNLNDKDVEAFQNSSASNLMKKFGYIK